uniref:Putative secreted protein n=1 Tax=Ixodes ricinus TaxID=34613 RepID=A0A090X9E6_IXORI
MVSIFCPMLSASFLLSAGLRQLPSKPWPATAHSRMSSTNDGDEVREQHAGAVDGRRAAAHESEHEKEDPDGYDDVAGAVVVGQRHGCPGTPRSPGSDLIQMPTVSTPRPSIQTSRLQVMRMYLTHAIPSSMMTSDGFAVTCRTKCARTSAARISDGRCNVTRRAVVRCLVPAAISRARGTSRYPPPR